MTRFKEMPYPDSAPQVGDRVRTKTERWGDVVIGHITECHNGYDDIVEGEKRFQKPWVLFRVEARPPGWPYDSDFFAPDVDEIVRMEETND